MIVIIRIMMFLDYLRSFRGDLPEEKDKQKDCMQTEQEFRKCLDEKIVGRPDLKSQLVEQCLA